MPEDTKYTYRRYQTMVFREPTDDRMNVEIYRPHTDEWETYNGEPEFWMLGTPVTDPIEPLLKDLQEIVKN